MFMRLTINKETEFIFFNYKESMHIYFDEMFTNARYARYFYDITAHNKYIYCRYIYSTK